MENDPVIYVDNETTIRLARNTAPSSVVACIHKMKEEGLNFELLFIGAEASYVAIKVMTILAFTVHKEGYAMFWHISKCKVRIPDAEEGYYTANLARPVTELLS